MEHAEPWANLRRSVPDIPQGIISTLLEKLRFQFMTPVQSCVIPMLCQNKDCAVQAETGSGKTLAYVIPLVYIVGKDTESGAAPSASPLALVILPTRVLAKQVFTVLLDFLLDKEIALLTGGADMALSANDGYAGVKVVVATPGRLFFELTSGRLDMRRTELLVLDEADKMAEVPEMPKIMEFLPKQRRTGLFSATLNAFSADHISRYLRNPHVVKISRQGVQDDDTFVIPENLSTWYTIVPYEEKPFFLARYIFELFLQHRALREGRAEGWTQPEDRPPVQKLIVFVLTCSLSEFLWKVFRLLTADCCIAESIGLYYLNGQQHSKKQRLQYEAFVGDTRFAVLFTTDIAARGVDLSDVSHVLQYDPPKQLNNFTHRSGRSGRVHRQGCAGIMLSPHEEAFATTLRQHGVALDQKESAMIFPVLSDLLSKPSLDSSGSARESSVLLFKHRITSLFSPANPHVLNSAPPQSDADEISMQIRTLRRSEKKLCRQKEDFERKIENARTLESAETHVSSMVKQFNNQVTKPLMTIQKKLATLYDQEAQHHNQRLYMYTHPFTAALREYQIADRDIFELCQEAFSSWVRGYQENDLKVVFDLARLPIGEYAVALGMLRLPGKLSELKSRFVIFRSPSGIDLDALPYRDARREEARKLRKAKEQNAKEQPRGQPKGRPKDEECAQVSAVSSLKAQESAQASVQPVSTSKGTKFASEKKLLDMLDKGSITEAQFDAMLDKLMENKNARKFKR